VGGHELLNILRDAGARILVAEESTVTIAEAVRAARNTALETIIVVEEGADASVMSLAELLACAPDEFDLEQHVSAVRPDDLLTLIYTSGTTGAPKGVQITHANAMSQIAAVSARLGLPDGISAISWLPMAHVAERLCTHYFPIAHGWRVTTCEDARSIAKLLTEVHPEFFFSPPRLWGKRRMGVLARTDGHVPSGSAARELLAEWPPSTRRTRFAQGRSALPSTVSKCGSPTMVRC
jgi:long-subunit acyl-CoA synthetase (AMP-forming)